MAFNFSWTEFDAQFYTEAKSMLNTALNKGVLPAKITDRIEVVELNMGAQPPELEMLEIGELAMDRFRGIFKLTYAGDAYIVLKTKVQANPVQQMDSDSILSTLGPPPYAATPLVLPLKLRISNLRLHGIIVLVVSKTKGVTLVFKNDPLESVDVNSTFDGLPKVESFLQKEIERQLRDVFQEDLPKLVHSTSLRKLAEHESARDRYVVLEDGASRHSGQRSGMHSSRTPRPSSPTGYRRNAHGTTSPSMDAVGMSIDQILLADRIQALAISEASAQSTTLVDDGGASSVVDTQAKSNTAFVTPWQPAKRVLADEAVPVTGSPPRYTVRQINRVAEAISTRSPSDPGLKRLVSQHSSDDDVDMFRGRFVAATFSETSDPPASTRASTTTRSSSASGAVDATIKPRTRIVHSIRHVHAKRLHAGSRAPPILTSREIDGRSVVSAPQGYGIGSESASVASPSPQASPLAYRSRHAGFMSESPSGWVSPPILSPVLQHSRFTLSARTTMSTPVSNGSEEYDALRRIHEFTGGDGSDDDWTRGTMSDLGAGALPEREPDPEETILLTNFRVPSHIAKLSAFPRTLSPYIRPIEHYIMRTMPGVEQIGVAEGTRKAATRRVLRRKIVGSFVIGPQDSGGKRSQGRNRAPSRRSA